MGPSETICGYFKQQNNVVLDLHRVLTPPLPVNAVCPHRCPYAVQDGLPGQLPVYRSTTDAVRTILRTEGWRGFYAGLSPSLLGSSECLLLLCALLSMSSGSNWGAYVNLHMHSKFSLPVIVLLLPPSRPAHTHKHRHPNAETAAVLLLCVLLSSCDLRWIFVLYERIRSWH